MLPWPKHASVWAMIVAPEQIAPRLVRRPRYYVYRGRPGRYGRGMARGPSDIGNTAVRLFLQDLGKAYDTERGMPPYTDRRDFPKVKDFFANRCCYCGEDTVLVQDHLIGVNKDSGGLHAWRNVVPACGPCNARKQGREWREFLLEDDKAGGKAVHAKIVAFIKHYSYEPGQDLGRAANELYQEAIATVNALKNVKVRWIAPELN